MLESFNTDIFEYQKLSLDEQNQRGILGRLKGIIADTVNPTRNNRKYSASLWEKVFNDPIMKERIENRCCFGELGHPADREETDMEKIAICLAEQPKKGKDGKLYGVFDILNTPNGKILKTLCDYGCNIGISSRGSGDVYTDVDGQDSVDEDTYDCQGFDAVLIPAVKEARLEYVHESLDKKKYNKTLRTKLQESIKKASADDRKVMQESLATLGMNLDEDIIEPEDQEQNTSSDEELLNEGRKETSELRSIMEEIVSYFQDTGYPIKSDSWFGYTDWKDVQSEINYNLDQLYEIAEGFEEELSDYIKTMDILADKARKRGISDEDIDDFYLDPDYAMFKDYLSWLQRAMKAYYDAEIAEYKDIEDESLNIEKDNSTAVDNNEAMVEELQASLKQNKTLQTKLISLQEKLSVSYAKESKLQEELDKQKKAISSLTKSANRVIALKERVNSLQKEKNLLESKMNSNANTINSLKESVNSNKKNNSSLMEQLSNKNNQIKKLSNELQSSKEENLKLTESVNDLQKDIDLKRKEYSKKLESNNQLVEKYKRIASTAVDKYITSKAISLGVTVNEIKNKLPESYTFSDIDEACESVQQYKVNLNKLPFVKMMTEDVKIKATPSKNEKLAIDNGIDDEVDDQLLNWANVNRY